MSGLSPARRLRTTTSDLTDFFRGSSHSSHQSRQVLAQSQAPTTAPLLEVPLAQDATTPSKKRSRIPFLGRTRKKSTHSVASSPKPSTSSIRDYGSSELVEKVAIDQHPKVSVAVSSEASSSRTTAYPPINVSPPSLGSKLAAHFAPRSRKNSLSHQGSSLPSPNDGNTSGTLSPPSSSPRSASFDSSSSGASGNRSSTPRATTRPTITVSLTADNLEEYGDLFTLPRKVISSKRSSHTSTRTFDHLDPQDSGSDSVTLGPSSPMGSTVQVANPLPDDHIDKNIPSGQRDTSTIERPTSRSSKGSRKKQTLSPETRPEDASGSELGIDSGEDSENIMQESISAVAMSAHERPAVTGTSNQTNEVPARRRSRLRQPLSSNEQPNRPPSIPLPPPPATNPPLAALPNIPSHSSHPSPKAGTSSFNVTPLRRPRAHTITSASSVHHVLSPSFQAPIVNHIKNPMESNMKDGSNAKFDIKTATPEQLRDALLSRNKQYDELASFLLKITESHVAEKAFLEKKISSLEREATRREKEIKGLSWLVVNNRRPSIGGPVTISRQGSVLDSDQDTQRSQSSGSSKLLSRRTQFTDDSGAESHQTSGAESLKSSETSGNESLSSLRVKKLRRPHTLGETSYNLYRNTSTTKRPSHKEGSGLDPVVPDMPYLSTPNNRSSVSSYTSSATSSTSSLLPPSPNASSAMSSLSAIPEAPTPPPKEGPETHTTTRRMSTSSVASASTGTSTYAANAKRIRPPSIAQVLDRPPAVEKVSEKTRSFGESSTT